MHSMVSLHTRLLSVILTAFQLGGLGGMRGGIPPPGTDVPTVDTAEIVHISSLALLKMLKHGTCSQARRVFVSFLFADGVFRSCWRAHGGHGSDAG